MINTESLLKLLRDLLSCSVNNVNFNVHGSCRRPISFITQCDKKLEQYGAVIESPTDEQALTHRILPLKCLQKKRDTLRV